MPSASFNKWNNQRRAALDEIENAHQSLGGTGPGRRYATQQVNQAYAILLSSQFQGYCRDLHTECVDALLDVVTPANLRSILRNALTWNRKLDTGNPSPGNIGADFNRLGLVFWDEVKSFQTYNEDRSIRLSELIEWRNAIAHQHFDPRKLAGHITLRVNMVRRWRQACVGLAESFDRVARDHIRSLTGALPW